MSAVPAAPKLYHITHIDNLPSILRDGGLWSDAAMTVRGGPAAMIGIADIKRRRRGLPVKCHAGDVVAAYVPFYFCPRSIMLYLIDRGNHPELTFRGGQADVLHLELDLDEVVGWADAGHRRWAFSLSNAGAVYTEFRKQRDQLDQIDWHAVAATDFRDRAIKEGKQSEFLVHEFVPWQLVRRVGACTAAAQRAALAHIAAAAHRPPVEIHRAWYF